MANDPTERLRTAMLQAQLTRQALQYSLLKWLEALAERDHALMDVLTVLLFERDERAHEQGRGE